MLKQRIITAAILVPVVVWGVLDLSNSGFAIACAFVLVLAGWEWSRLLGLKQIIARSLYVSVLLVLLVLANAVHSEWILVAGCVGWVAIALLCVMPVKFEFNFCVKACIGLFIFVACWQGLVTVRASGSVYLLLVMVMVWVVDSAAYFAGKAWGKHALAKLISPNKTIEGTLGGVGAALVLAMLACRFLPGLTILHNRYWPMFFLTLLTAVAAVVGDLFESMMKRWAGVKDSGKCLPGHGGVLDRIDGLIAAIPVFALGLFIGGVY